MMNTKRIIILALIVLAVAMPAMATDYGSGKTKAGVILGNSFNATIGFDTGGVTEWNIIAGSNYNFSYFWVGANVLFTLADINIEGETFPLSFGPQASVGWWGAYGYGGMYVDVLAMLRWEYTFNFPLNLFIEFGAGLGMNFGDYYTNNLYLDFAYRAGLGVRYVFGM